MNVDNMIIEYLANLDFNYQQIFQLVEELNVFSKMAKKKITMPLIKKLVSNK
jgi:chromosomal replication initiation ATPase DnaA